MERRERLHKGRAYLGQPGVRGTPNRVLRERSESVRGGRRRLLEGPHCAFHLQEPRGGVRLRSRAGSSLAELLSLWEGPNLSSRPSDQSVGLRGICCATGVAKRS